MQTCNYWADNWAIGALEVLLQGSQNKETGGKRIEDGTGFCCWIQRRNSKI